MTEPDPQAAVTPPAEPEPEATPKGERIGTILTAVAIGVVVILVADVVMKGKLLAPLFALLPAPKTPPAEEPGAETRPAGE